MAYVDYFGFLPVDESFQVSVGSITPLPKMQRAVEWVTKYANVDGYLYPGLVHTRRLSARGKKSRKVPKSERPALLYRLPPTHRIELPNHPDDQEKARYGFAGFLMHLLAFLYGYRCHFHDWWIDGRVSVKSTCDYHKPRSADTAYCLATGLATWSQWPDRQRIVMLNALFLKTRTRAYELEWERFQGEYQVFDALYAVARGLNLVPAGVPHAKRVPAVCHGFGIAVDQTRVDTIVRLRNPLLHEALWDERMPGEARSQESFQSSIWLERLSRRVGLALLGIDGAYVRSAWWGLGTHAFHISRKP